MERLIMREIVKWYDDKQKLCLLIDGARQVGKTYTVHQFLVSYCKRFVEIDLFKDSRARNLLSSARNADEIHMFLSILFPADLVPNETVIFIDEVQECPELVTIVKYLVEDGRYRYILSGSLMGVELSHVKSIPVGYMKKLQMYPLNFLEFCMALGMEQDPLDYIRTCFTEVKPINPAIHDRMLYQYKLYILIGGMPAAVQMYLDTKDLAKVDEVHENICQTYKMDISKYDVQNKHALSNVFELIPKELNSQNKRFHFNSTDAGRSTKNVSDSFTWLVDAGVAIPVYCADAPCHPLKMSNSRNLLKLFLCDVGLLSHMYFNDDVQVKILSDEVNVNFGAIYENAVAQELTSDGYFPYYYNSHKYGELDLLAEINSEIIPIEIKSGKTYTRHVAISGIMAIEQYGLKKAYVFSNNGDIRKEEGIIYMPIYMSMFLKRMRRDSYVVDVDTGPWNIPKD